MTYYFKQELFPFILNEFELSRWAYFYCKDKVDDPEIRKNITKSEYAYRYCKWINNDPEVRKYITDSVFLKEITK